MSNKTDINKENKENFCLSCSVAVPLLTATIGSSSATIGSSNNNNKTYKKILLYVGISLIIISILASIFILYKKYRK